LIAAPPWLSVECYDIDARAVAAPADGPESLLPLVRTLLVDRFKLEAHPDTRVLPAYALTLARRDRQLGAQLRPTQADCTRATTLTQEAGGDSASEPDAPTLFVALEEQLGLRLESRRMNVPVLAIDSIDRPTEN